MGECKTVCVIRMSGGHTRGHSSLRPANRYAWAACLEVLKAVATHSSQSCRGPASPCCQIALFVVSFWSCHELERYCHASVWHDAGMRSPPYASLYFSVPGRTILQSLLRFVSQQACVAVFLRVRKFGSAREAGCSPGTEHPFAGPPLSGGLFCCRTTIFHLGGMYRRASA